MLNTVAARTAAGLEEMVVLSGLSRHRRDQRHRPEDRLASDTVILGDEPIGSLVALLGGERRGRFG
jgi:hypothetical protein